MAKKKADKRRQEKEMLKEQKEKEERKRLNLQELEAKRKEKPGGTDWNEMIVFDFWSKQGQHLTSRVRSKRSKDQKTKSS